MSIAGAVGIIAGLVTAATGIYSAAKSSSESKKSRYTQAYFNQKNTADELARYAKERDDQIAAWNMQNQYNDPSQQMTRLRQAGLNPHLVYGKGADTTADSIRSPSHMNMGREAPKFNTDLSGLSSIGQGLNSIYDLKYKQAQTDNVNESTALMQQENILKQASTAKTLQETSRGKFDLEQAKELKDSVVMQAKLQNEKTKADTQFTLNQDQRNELKTTSDIKMTAEKILSEQLARAKTQKEIQMLTEQITAVKQSTNIKQYHQELTRMGIAPNDPWYFRGLMNLVNGNINVDPVNDAVESVKQKYKQYKHSKSNRGAGSSY